MKISQMPANALVDFLKEKRLLVMLGAGGVGKTSSSIAIAILAASKGLRVGLLSIDPAKRLAAALGISLGHDLERITFDFAPEFRGSLEGAMLDQKEVLDSMVKRFASDATMAGKIFANRLYQAVSLRFAGAIEYMALAKVQEMLDSNRYDLVVLDTPPDTHALDFIARPNILAEFSENRVMGWLIKPFHLASRLGAEKLFSVGERLMGGIAKITGIKTLTMVSEFMILMQGVIEGFQISGERVKSSLGSSSTAFFLVCVGTQSEARAALNLSSKLFEMGHRFDGVIVNRCLPKEVNDALKECQNLENQLTQEMMNHLSQRAKSEEWFLKTIEKEIEKQTGKDPLMVLMDEQEYSLHEKEGVFKFAMAFDNL